MSSLQSGTSSGFGNLTALVLSLVSLTSAFLLNACLSSRRNSLKIDTDVPQSVKLA